MASLSPWAYAVTARTGALNLAQFCDVIQSMKCSALQPKNRLLYVASVAGAFFSLSVWADCGRLWAVLYIRRCCRQPISELNPGAPKASASSTLTYTCSLHRCRQHTSDISGRLTERGCVSTCCGSCCCTAAAAAHGPGRPSLGGQPPACPSLATAPCPLRATLPQDPSPPPSLLSTGAAQSDWLHDQ